MREKWQVKNIHKKCKLCGFNIYAKSGNRIYCDDCQAVAYKIIQHFADRRYKTLQKEKRKKH